jgi:SOS-response transcriptional repressor LexA
LERTDSLAARMGVSLRQLAGKIGISNALLFACRKGKTPLTNKTWSKLEHLEKQQSKKESAPDNPNLRITQSSGSPKKLGVRETTHSTWEESPIGRRLERMVPVIGWAHAGEAGSYEELPKSWQNRVPTDCGDPKAFGVSLEGDSMEPKFSDGDILIVQPTTEAHSGCFVVARFVDDSVIFRRLEMRRDRIILVPLNPQYLASEHTADEFSWIYPVWARITKMWKK